MASDTLFNTFSKNLTLHNPEYSDTFLCPLQVHLDCRKEYPRRDIHLSTGAHIWPKSLGGIQETLACEKCNSHMGTELEKHMCVYDSFLTSERLRYRMSYDGIEGIEQGEMEITKEDGTTRTNFYVSDKLSNPYTTEAIKNFAKTGQLPEMNVEIYGGYIERRVNLGYLHFAYMYLFHEYGYEWFFSPAARMIRKQLRNISERIFESPWRLVEAELPGIRSDLAQHIFVTSPQHLEGIMVVSPIQRYRPDRRIGVFFLFNQTNLHDSAKSCVLSSRYLPDDRVEVKLPSKDSHKRLREETGTLKDFVRENFGLKV